jgi:hypothetical protein
MHTTFYLEDPKVSVHLGELDIDGRIILQEVLGRTNHLISFDTIRTAYKTTRPTVLLLHVWPERVYRAVA